MNKLMYNKITANLNDINFRHDLLREKANLSLRINGIKALIIGEQEQ